MKKTFQKTLIAAAAGVALMSAVGTASANSLLFPYFTTASGAQSVLSISANSTAGISGSGGKEVLHYVYNYGPSCIHFDGNGSLTANDLMQHSIASSAAGGFGKAVGTDASSPFYFPEANSYGFLTVTTKSTVGAMISGDMAIVDPSTGLVTSYAGISNYLETGTAVNAANEGNFSFVNNNHNLSFYGSGFVDTSWYGVVLGNMNTAIVGSRNWTAAVSVSNNGFVYNNDESPLSGTAQKTIQCAGTVAPKDLMTSAQLAAVGGNGGMFHSTAGLFAVSAPDGILDAATGVYLLKLQKVQAAVGAPFAGKQFLHAEQPGAF